MTSREDLLNQYIDARIAGESADATGTDDPALQELLETVDQVRAGGEIEWPEGDFPARLSRGLRAGLKPLGAPLAADDGIGVEEATPASGTGGAAVNEDEAGRRRGWRWYMGQFAGMAAAAIVIGLFALGLAFILGDWGGEVRAPGAVVEPGEVPGTLLYTEYDGEQTIARIDADGTDQQDLASRPSPRHDIFDLAWSPDGERIAYFDPVEPNRDAPAEIAVISADGDEIESVDAGQFHGTLRLDTQLNWSRNGSSLAFAHLVQENERTRVSVVHPETGETQTTGSGQDALDSNDAHPAWAPDQWALAFARNEGENQRSIQLILQGMSQPMPLVEGRPRANQPSWSPDGDSVVYIDSAQNEDRSNIFTVDVDSRASERVTDHERWDYSPTWSSRDKIAFMSDPGDRNYDIFVVEPDGSDLRNLTDDYDWTAYLPDWSDDGRYLSFTSHSQDQDRWRINVYDMDLDQLYTVLESENPLFGAEWQPEDAPEESTALPQEADADAEEVDPELLEKVRESAERYISDDESSTALTVDGKEITAGQIEFQQIVSEQNLSSMRGSTEELDQMAPEMSAYQSGFIELIEEYGPENVGLGSALNTATMLTYAEENDLVATGEQLNEAMEHQRETWEMASDRDAEFPGAINETIIDVLGEDVYWNEYLPDTIQESLTEQNVLDSVWEDESGPEEDTPFIWLERDIFLADFRAELVREADIEVVDESALGDADLDMALEYITEGYPDFQRSLLDLRSDRESEQEPTVEEDRGQ